MSGIYIHIPFCKQRCTYCDFYTVVAPKLIEDTVDSIVKEISLRNNYLADKHIQTIYFGGGTPSVLSKSHFLRIFEALNQNFKINSNAEITFEANPDDLTDDFFTETQNLPFNRISIGIQSFNDADLKRINRRHTAEQAIQAVKRAQNAGFSNLSIDLIYGLPDQTLEDWKNNIGKALILNVQHISAYGLTYEKGTALWTQRKKKVVTETPDEKMNEMYELLRYKIEKAGFEAYEISNFSKPGYRSQHNSAYWKMIPYIGFGPSAHSYNITNRQWNVSSIKNYNESIENNSIFWETEELTLNDRYNDYIMVSMRTAEGASINYISSNFGKSYTDYFIHQCAKFITDKLIEINPPFYSLTTNGVEISNFIISDLMKV